MTISPAHVEKLKELYKARYGAVLSNQEALDRGIKLVGLIQQIYQPMSKDKYRGISKHYENTN